MTPEEDARAHAIQCRIEGPGPIALCSTCLPRYEALFCPTCRADIGQPCRTKQGKRFRFSGVHKARALAAAPVIAESGAR